MLWCFRVILFRSLFYFSFTVCNTTNQSYNLKNIVQPCSHAYNMQWHLSFLVPICRIHRVSVLPTLFLYSFVTRSFFFHKHFPCAHRVVPLSHWNLKFSKLRHFQSICVLTCVSIVKWFVSWNASFLHTYRNISYDGFYRMLFFHFIS